MSKKIIKELKSYKSLINKKYASEVDEVVDLYAKKNIPNYKTAEGILRGLMRSGSTTTKALAKIDKYRTTESITGRLSRVSDFDVVRDYLINYTIKFKVDGKNRERTKTTTQRTSQREMQNRLQVFSQLEVEASAEDYRAEIEFDDVTLNSVKYYDSKPLSNPLLGGLATWFGEWTVSLLRCCDSIKHPLSSNSA
jgi:hypothetical protein